MRPGACCSLGLLLLLAGCASTAPQDGWWYRSSNGLDGPKRPMALYGAPATSPDYIMECRAAEGFLDLLTADVEFTAGRRIAIRAGRASWAGDEIVDPPDGIATSRARVPINSSVLTELERGAALQITTADGMASLPASPTLARVVSACRSLHQTKRAATAGRPS